MRGSSDPSGSFAANTGSITGTVFLPDGVTPYQGINVIARKADDPLVTATILTATIKFITQSSAALDKYSKSG